MEKLNVSVEEETFTPSNQKVPKELIEDANRMTVKINKLLEERFIVKRNGQTTLGRHFVVRARPNQTLVGISKDDIADIENELRMEFSHITLGISASMNFFQEWKNVPSFSEVLQS